MKTRLVELLKDLVILALLVSLLLLALVALPAETIRNHQWLSNLLQPVSPLLGLSQAELTYVQTELPAFDASQPTCISVMNESGRSTAMWDFAALDAAFETYGGILGQAMDTAADFTPVTQAELFSVLSGPSVSFQYEAVLPASLLAYWLDASIDPQAPDASLCILAPRDGFVDLYLVGETGFRAASQVASGPLEQLLRQPAPDGSAFAFERKLDLDPFCILPDRLPVLHSGFVSNPCTPAYLDSLATELGFNPYNETRYQDESGTTFFSELNSSLQISASGRLLLTSNPQPRFTAPSDEPHALVELARQIIAEAVTPGIARIYLSGFSAEDGRTVCTFDYYYNAVPLALYHKHAVTVTFTGRSITELDLQLARFTRAEQELRPLPIAQAQVLVPAGKPLALQYCITPDQMLSVGWKGE